MPQKLIIDADPGIGDALAILAAMMDPTLDVTGITACGGTVSGLQAAHNIQTVLQLIDPPKRPWTGSSDVEATPISVIFGGWPVSPVDLNGANGLGGFCGIGADLHHPRESAKLIVDLVRDNPNAVTILTLGPLTNIALAFELAPELPGLLNGLVCLGGSLKSGGDVSAVAEFNIYSNPAAARMVLRSPCTKTLVPLDVSARGVLAADQCGSVEIDLRIRDVVTEMLQFSLRAHHQHLGFEGIQLHEIVALAAVTRPQLFESRFMAIDVETSGELTRGMTVFDRRGIQHWQKNIDVLVEVDSVGIIDYFRAMIGGGI